MKLNGTGRLYLAASALTLAACGGPDRRALFGGGPQPDVLPVMLNREHPFRYPPALYAQRVQGNVSLRLYVDPDGLVLAESTLVAESSGNPALDSAAIDGSRELRFSPARRKGEAIGVTIIYPVYFRHPEAAPLPGDSILRRADVRQDTT